MVQKPENSRDHEGDARNVRHCNPRSAGKKLFGGGFLISDQCAREKAEAENVIVTKEKEAGEIIEWYLSQREARVIDALNAKAEKK